MFQKWILIVFVFPAMIAGGITGNSKRADKRA
jgi:hypothetical protein